MMPPLIYFHTFLVNTSRQLIDMTRHATIFLQFVLRYGFVSLLKYDDNDKSIE